MKKNISDRKIFPLHGWIGLLFIAIFWALNWCLSGIRTHVLFFPLWLGYCLTVDAFTVFRKGNSLLTRNWRAYIGLFFVSILGWWMFEAINLRTQNWSYLGRELFTRTEFGFLASISFSTVIPAVFGTAELIGTTHWVKYQKPWIEISNKQRSVVLVFIIGVLMFVLLMFWPKYFFPFVWLSVFFILEPINVWLGFRSISSNLSIRDWRIVSALFAAVIICGFFWEMWNFNSYPKWIYHVPYVDFARIFEMPLLGYGGYLPFSLELFALYHLVIGLVNRRDLFRYFHIIQD
ncbi:MAG: hypothetical protein PVF83_11275 [Anaerolineales bacterium]|jgi:hypothetical protein